jgi:hypothetical protein
VDKVVGGLSALGAVLYSIGISRESIVEYETALKSDKFLVMAHGTSDEMATSKRILETTGAAHIAAHQSAPCPARLRPRIVQRLEWRHASHARRGERLEEL